MSTSEEKRAALRQRRENRTTASAATMNALGGPNATNSSRRGGGASQNLGDKPLLESVYSTSLRVLGHSSTGQVIFTTSQLTQLGLTSLQPIAQLGAQLQRIILDNNALESLEDLRYCHSLVHLSVAGNKLSQDNVFRHLVQSAGTLNYLNLAENRLTSLAGVEKMRFLVTLLVDKNQLTSLEVEASEEGLKASANEHLSAHTTKLLDDIIVAIDETIASEKSKVRSRRGSITGSGGYGENLAVPIGASSNQRMNSMRMEPGMMRSARSGMFSGGSGLGGGAASKSVTFGADSSSEASGSIPCEMTSPLRFLVSLWRFSASENELKTMNPRVFERCPLRLLNLSSNALTTLDCVLPLHKSLMVLIADNNEISHLPASTSTGGLRRAGSRHLADVPHPSKTATHPDVAHLNFQMMTRLVSLNLGQNNIASFQEVAELKSLPQLRHLTLSNCTLCSLPTHTDIDQREKALVKTRADTVRADQPAKSVGRTTSGVSSNGIEDFHSNNNNLGDTIEGIDSGFGSLSNTQNGTSSNVIGRKKSSVIINSPSANFDPEDAHALENHGANSSSSQSFAVEALIRPDDSAAVTLRTPEEQDQSEFNKRTTEERYRLRILQSIPQLQTLDGIPCSTEDIAEAQQLAGGHLREERTKAITKYIKPTSGAAGSALRRLVNRQKDSDEENEDY